MVEYRLSFEGHAVYENYEDEISCVAISTGG